MKRSQNIFLVGPMGSGKSTIGKQLATLMKLDFIDSDKEIEAKCGADISWIFDVEGEEGFRKREQSMIDELTLEKGIVLATGGGAVVEKNNRVNLISRGTVVYLHTNLEQLVERTYRDKSRPLLQNDDPKGTLERLMEEREPLYNEVADYVVNTDDRSVKAVAQEIVKLIEEDSQIGNS